MKKLQWPLLGVVAITMVSLHMLRSSVSCKLEWMPNYDDRRAASITTTLQPSLKNLNATPPRSTINYYDNTSKKSHPVLPIRRFCIKKGTGHFLKNFRQIPSWKQCHEACTKLPACDAWEWNAHQLGCSLYAFLKDQDLTSTNITTTINSTLATHQAPNNDPSYVVGFLQRRAKVVRLVENGDETISMNQIKETTKESFASVQTPRNRILLILHSHHTFPPSVLSTIMHELLPSYLPLSLFDVVVISPLEEPLHAFNGGPIVGQSLVNPFVPFSNATTQPALGANSHMSLPIAMTRFPGYRGYLLLNDDVCVRLWKLNPALWFGDRPWVQFPTYTNGQLSPVRRQLSRTTLISYPHGPYLDWAWWNLDSGRVERTELGTTRSNFDAAMAAQQEFCQTKSHYILQGYRRREFCSNATSSELRPYMHGKADVFYVPGNELGQRMADTLALLGEHDVMLEIAVPLAYTWVVPDDAHLVIPYCDGLQMMKKITRQVVWRRMGKLKNVIDYQYAPYYFTPYDEEAECAAIHPVKFSSPEGVAYWKRAIREECSTCVNISRTRSPWTWKPVDDLELIEALV